MDPGNKVVIVAMSHASENTMAPLQKGVEHGVDLIEFDINLS